MITLFLNHKIWLYVLNSSNFSISGTGRSTCNSWNMLLKILRIRNSDTLSARGSMGRTVLFTTIWRIFYYFMKHFKSHSYSYKFITKISYTFLRPRKKIQFTIYYKRIVTIIFCIGVLLKIILWCWFLNL